MDARESLCAVRRSRMQLEALLEKRRWCREVANCRSGGRSEALERLQQEVDRRIDSLAGQELAAMRRIDALGDPGQREVLRLRYLNGWAWKEIARRMSYSQDWVKHLHARALRAMADRSPWGSTATWSTPTARRTAPRWCGCAAPTRG